MVTNGWIESYMKGSKLNYMKMDELFFFLEGAEGGGGGRMLNRTFSLIYPICINTNQLNFLHIRPTYLMNY